MFSKREREGYMSIDHRHSPGISEEMAAEVSARARIHISAVPGGTHLETPTFKCAHCPRQVVMNPDRSRARNYCRRCDWYICDDCALLRKVSGIACRPWKKYLDNWYDCAELGRPQVDSAIPTSKSPA